MEAVAEERFQNKLLCFFSVAVFERHSVRGMTVVNELETIHEHI